MNEDGKEIPTELTDAISGVEAVETILLIAVRMNASDVHFDPTNEHIGVRLRIDGHIEFAGALQKRIQDELIARLKILAGCRTDIHFVPQDGRWKTVVQGEEYNIRASFMPTYHGENAVLRLLPARPAALPSLASLGFTPDHVRMMVEALGKTHGLILVTGPTGSGKTTTLHACLTLKSSEPISIVTLEDPVEYEMPGVRQVHIRHDHGVTFAGGLRSVLRQDPDVIMVGEIRDSETARVAVHTALTGHLVLSTLHTNSALETIPRLIDMGIDHYLLASTLVLVVAQRLVRKVCHDCEGSGCTECRYKGYSSRSVIAEALAFDGGMRARIGARASSGECEEYARSCGFISIAEDGMEKIDWGVTTHEEVIRVLAPSI